MEECSKIYLYSLLFKMDFYFRFLDQSYLTPWLYVGGAKELQPSERLDDNYCCVTAVIVTGSPQNNTEVKCMMPSGQQLKRHCLASQLSSLCIHNS